MKQRKEKLDWLGNCGITAMGIMPHSDVERALALSLGLDIPFWPQLPRVSYLEDMYAQAAWGFPGIKIDREMQRVTFNSVRFEAEMADYSLKLDQTEYFALATDQSVVYHRFLEQELGGYIAIRGQHTGPVSLGFRVVDEQDKPIIYNEAVRILLYDFIQRKANLQRRQLQERNPNAFVWLDEPGLGWVFSGFTGYDDVQARRDYLNFMEGIEGPHALHLCANVNLPYLLELGIDLLSFDAYQLGSLPLGYAQAVGQFLGQGGIICWGIVPTDSTHQSGETPDSLADRLSHYWQRVAESSGLTPEQVARQALLAPARCCLKNVGQVGSAGETKQSQGGVCPADRTIEEELVEKAFQYLKELSAILKSRYKLA